MDSGQRTVSNEQFAHCLLLTAGCSLFTVNVFPKPIPLSIIQIIHVLVVGKGLTLKTNVAVSEVAIFVLKPSVKVFQQIPHVKHNQPQLQLLPEMNPLVIQQKSRSMTTTNQHKRPQRHSINPQKWQHNEYHRAKMTDL